ncbi:MAG: hypothetical protein KJO13_03880 [Gammaproteobacteria bacterium]|nr:hypothetical protein [Gammaproteobacteria bacterium]
MDTLTLIVVIATLGVVVLVAAVLRRNRTMVNKYGDDFSATAIRPPIAVTRNQPPKRTQKFYGVSVRPGTNCCDAVREIVRNRYLQGEAPSLPLPNCDRSDCQCVMKPEDDRRSQIDRRDDAFSAYGEFRSGWHPRRRHERKERRKR